MDVYLYCGALYCEECVQQLKREVTPKPENPDDSTTYDSDDYPKGPYPNGGGEADFPQHCDSCTAHLENPLTTDGDDYVREAIRNAGTLDPGKTIQTWKDFYSYLFD